MQQVKLNKSAWCSFFALFDSAELAILVGNIFYLLPPAKQANVFLLPSNDYYRHPKPDITVFRIFLLSFLVSYLLSLFYFSRPSVSERIFNGFKKYVLMSFGWFVLMAFLQLQAVLHTANPQPWAHILWWATAACFTSKALWPLINKFFPEIPVLPLRKLPHRRPPAFSSPGWAMAVELLLVAVFIWLILFIPDLRSLDARLLVTGNAQRDNNTFISGPTFAVSMGLVPVVDVRSLYGVGLPVMFNAVIKMTHGVFSYLAQSRILMWTMIIYYFLWYVLVRGCVRWWPLSLGILLFCLQLKVFGPGAGAINLYGGLNITPVRFFFDIFFLLTVLGHAATLRRSFLWIAALWVGTQMFYVLAPGLCLLIAWGAYLMWARLPWIESMRLFLLPLAVFFGINFLCIGGHIFSPDFWRHYTEQMRYSNDGMWLFPYFSLVCDRFRFFISLMVLVLFLFSMTITWVLRQSRPQDIRLAMIFVLSAYGLMDYQQFIMIAESSVLFRHATLFVTVAGLWVSFLLDYAGPGVRRAAAFGLVLAGLFCLSQNPKVLAYPNLLIRSKNPNIDLTLPQSPIINKDVMQYPAVFKLPVNALGQTDEDFRTEKDFSSDRDLVNYVDGLFDFKQDAALIDSLTSPQERVALISSHELPILAAAQRKPFFYVFPLLCPRPMKMRVFPVDELFSQENLDLTLRQIDEQKPRFIFIHKVLMSPTIPQAYVYDSYATVKIIEHVRETYVPYKDGYYLMVLKRAAP
jgi:hypothetical protein